MLTMGNNRKRETKRGKEEIMAIFKRIIIIGGIFILVLAMFYKVINYSHVKIEKDSVIKISSTENTM